MNNQTDTRRGGFYWRDGVPYLSVTEILKVINKPQLMYWFGREVYYSMLKDPTMAEREALASPYLTSDKAKERGSTIHSIVESFKTTGEEINNIIPAYQGYARAFYDFMRDVKPVIVEQEKTVFSESEKIAGTLDIYAKIGNSQMVIDVKTGKDIYIDFGLQLSAYAHMIQEEGKPVDEIAVLLLETGADNKPTGKYKFQTMVNDWEAFVHCKKLYEYLNKEKLIKLEYIVN